MANEINVCLGEAGLSLVAILSNENRLSRWNGSAMVAKSGVAVAAWATGAIALSEILTATVGTGDYSGTIPEGLLATLLNIEIYKSADVATFAGGGVVPTAIGYQFWPGYASSAAANTKADIAAELAAYNTTGVAKEATVGGIASVFTGITRLAYWLMGMSRKDAMNAAAKAEINAIHDGGVAGTFDETTDSNEAIRDTAPLGTAMRGTDSVPTNPLLTNDSRIPTSVIAAKSDLPVAPDNTNIGVAAAQATTAASDAAIIKGKLPAGGEIIAKAGDAMSLTSGERTTMAAAVWNALTSGLTTARSIGKWLLDRLVGYANYTLPTSSTSAANGRIEPTYLTGYQYCRLRATIPVVDADDEPVILTDRLLLLTAWPENDPASEGFELSSTGTDISLTITGDDNNIIVVDGAAENFETAGQYDYRVYDATDADNLVALVVGVIKIEEGRGSSA
jgi:hypothetical protein